MFTYNCHPQENWFVLGGLATVQPNGKLTVNTVDSIPPPILISALPASSSTTLRPTDVSNHLRKPFSLEQLEDHPAVEHHSHFGHTKPLPSDSFLSCSTHNAARLHSLEHSASSPPVHRHSPCHFTTDRLTLTVPSPLFQGVLPPIHPNEPMINSAEVTSLSVPPLVMPASSSTALPFLPFTSSPTTDVSNCFRGLSGLKKPKPHPTIKHRSHLSHTKPMPVDATAMMPLPPVPNGEGTHVMSVLTPSENMENTTTLPDHLLLHNGSFVAYTSTVEDRQRAYGSNVLLALQPSASTAMTTLSLPFSLPLHLATRSSLGAICSSALEPSNPVGSPLAPQPMKVSSERHSAPHFFQPDLLPTFRPSRLFGRTNLATVLAFRPSSAWKRPLFSFLMVPWWGYRMPYPSRPSGPTSSRPKQL